MTGVQLEGILVKGSNIPNPTNFNNSRSKAYINSCEDTKVKKLETNFSKTRPKISTLHLERTCHKPFSRKLSGLGDSKENKVGCLLTQRYSPKNGVNFSPVKHKWEKITPKQLPSGNDSDLSLVFTTLGDNSPEEDKKISNDNCIEFEYMMQNEQPEKYLVSIDNTNRLI